MAESDKTAELLWSAPRTPRRGPRPSMTLETIVDAGIDLADRDGIGGVTMAKVAASMGATKMSLYRYVPGREELLAVMADRAMGVGPDLGGVDHWRTGLFEFASSMYAMGVEHPWVFEVATGARVFGPNEMSWLDTGLGVLRDTGLPEAAKLDSIVLVTSHVRQLTAQHAQSSTTESDTARLIANVLAVHGDSYPCVAAAFAGTRADDQDGAFAFGLARILDGLAAHITS